MQGFTQKQIYRPASFAAFKYSEFKIGNLKFYIPHHHLAYDTPHPSIAPYSVKKILRSRNFSAKNIKEHKIWFRLEETVN
ncbi:hypothetical protein MASR1M29_02500 [Cloacibacterium normanense]